MGTGMEACVEVPMAPTGFQIGWTGFAEDGRDIRAARERDRGETSAAVPPFPSRPVGRQCLSVCVPLLWQRESALVLGRV